MMFMDPTTTFDGENVMCDKHEDNAKKVLFGLALHPQEPTGLGAQCR